jgi:hypothetical protein
LRIVAGDLFQHWEAVRHDDLCLRLHGGGAIAGRRSTRMRLKTLPAGQSR